MGSCHTAVLSRKRHLLDPGNHGSCWAERHCLVSFVVQQVNIWYRRSSHYVQLPSALSVEISHIGADVLAKRTETGKQRCGFACSLDSPLPGANEAWFWDAPDDTKASASRVTFRVPQNAQLVVSVLETGANCQCVSATAEVLGQTCIGVADDVLPILELQDPFSKELMAATQGDSSSVMPGCCRPEPEEFAGLAVLRGRLCQPLVLDRRICGEVKTDLVVRCEGSTMQLHELMQTLNLSNSHGGCRDSVGSMEAKLAAHAKEDAWSPRVLPQKRARMANSKLEFARFESDSV